MSTPASSSSTCVHDPTLSWGILSTASILKHFVPAVAAAPKQSIAAVASRSLEKAEAAAKQYGIPNACGSYEALLARPDIDAIYVPLPVDMHVEWVLKCFQAGKHVLVEKPIALSVADVETMHAAARDAKRILAEGYMSLHTAQQRYLEDTFSSDATEPSPIGRLLTIRTQFAYPLSRRGFRESPAGVGGGSLWDVGCYCVSIGQALAGRDARPTHVSAVAHRLRNSQGTDGDGGSSKSCGKLADVLLTATVAYDTGVVHTFECGLVGTARVGCELTGTGGRVLIPAPFKPDPAKATVIVEKVSGEPGAVAVSSTTVTVSEDLDDKNGTASPHLYRWQLDRFLQAFRSPEIVLDFLAREERMSAAITATVVKIHEVSVDVDFGSSRL